MKYEYRVETLSYEEGDDLLRIEDELNKVGNENWELISTNYIDGALVFVFKKDKIKKGSSQGIE